MKQSHLVIVALIVAAAWSPVRAQQGPPPEIRAMIQGIVTAANGDDAGWKAYEQKYFSPTLLKQGPADLHKQIVDRFGTIAVDRVERRGPDAPLQLNIKGSKASGTIVLTIDGDEAVIQDVVIEGAKAPQPSGSAPAIPVNGSMASTEIDQRLDVYFTQLAKDEVFSGVALVAKDGVPVFMRAYGMADREKKVANTVRTRFNIGSINKAFTQIAINQLIADDKLSINDTLGKFYPDYPQAVSRAATIAQLLGHQAGLADFFGPDFNRADKKQFASNADYFKFVGTQPPLFSPGARNQYCNGCYIALGAIVEKVSGMPYEKYVAEKIFAKAEMTSTGYPRTDQPASDIALGYTRRVAPQGPTTSAPQALVSNISLHGVTGSAAGGGYSTALDLLTFTKAVRAGKFPSADAGMAIAGGAPGTNAVVEMQGPWTVIVLTNFDPPTGEEIGTALANALSR